MNDDMIKVYRAYIHGARVGAYVSLILLIGVAIITICRI
jgi:hypothetical protein